MEASFTSPNAESEWRRNWPMVLAAMVGVSFISIPTMTLGLFMAPLQHEFGWSRTEISAGLTLFALVNLPLMPLAGRLVDRFGARRVALPGLVLGSLAFAAFGLLTGSLVQWFAIWTIFTLVAPAMGLHVWSAAVSSAFGGSRGLALALLLCGPALSQAFAPIASRWLIDGYGWRAAYFGLAAAWGGVAFLLSLFLFKDRQRTRTDGSAGQPAAAPVGGLSVGEALRSFTMHRIALATFLQTSLSAAVVVHLVPLLTSFGLSRAEAASFALILAAAAITGKLVTGWLVDRISAAWLPTLCYAGPAIALLLLMRGSATPALLVLAIALLGYCSGASLQLTTYLTTRYVGLRNFATIFGMVSIVLALAGGLGPLIAGAIFDQQGSYSPLLLGGGIVGLLAGLAVLGLGRYPDFTTHDQAPTGGIQHDPELSGLAASTD